MKKRVFSGIQPTGNIHIGNYLGAIKNWVKSQDAYDNIFCVVNSHAITVKQDPQELKKKTYEMAAMLLACGIEMEKSILFIQSEVAAHCELAWILNCNIPMGDMSRMTQFKDKSAKNPKNVNVGLFAYPALMAADILLYQADGVPVGEDQKQHIELTRDVAERFNRDYGETFKIPAPMIPQVGARVMGLDDPTIKMSKSIDNPKHAISMLDDADTILKKFKKAQTDSDGIIEFNKERAGVFNLLSIYQAFSEESQESIMEKFAGKGYGDLKKGVAEMVIEKLEPIQKRYYELTENEENIKSVMKENAAKASAIADETLKKAKEAVGLI